MRADTALKIISSLADGCDPDTGEILPRDHVFQQPDVVRALAVAVAALRRHAGREDRDSRKPAKAGRPWTAEEDEGLLLAFDGGATIRDLAEKHERTTGAIESRLVRLGRLEAGSQRSPAATSPKQLGH